MEELRNIEALQLFHTLILFCERGNE